MAIKIETPIRVTYYNGHSKKFGIIKSITNKGAFVVYNCGGNWKDYKNYTAAFTPFDELVLG